MARRYHTLAVCEQGTWGPQFGSWDKADVLAERQDYRDQGYKSADLKIITTGGGRNQVRDAVADLNQEGL